MDPNQSRLAGQQPIQPVNPVIPGQTQVVQPTPPPATKPPSSHKTLFIVLITGALLILLLAGGFVLYSQQQNQSLSAPGMEKQSIAPLPTIEPSPASPEEQEILKIDAGDVEKDLQDLNKDVQQL